MMSVQKTYRTINTDSAMCDHDLMKENQRLRLENQMLREKITTDARIVEAAREAIELLDHLPALAFSKDADTGRYLACSQIFADYAHRQSPEEVAGLTDHDIFDPDTADHFVEDDGIALSMESPYLFFEDVPDAAGNPRHFQTTKLQYRTRKGKRRTLGLCVDITNLVVNQQRETQRIRQAVEQSRYERVIYSHIADSLTQDYVYIYFADLETDKFIKYQPGKSNKELSTLQQSGDFFTVFRKHISDSVYREDQELVLASFTRKSVLDALDRQSKYSLIFRMMVDNRPCYVNMKVTRMKNDPRYLVIGFMNVDLQIKKNNQQFEHRIREVRSLASRDQLTGVKNKLAYSRIEQEINRQIASREPLEFALVVCDINDLKVINDTQGHQAGDDYIRSACERICAVFRHSPVFRIGGDEFAVISSGQDYRKIDQLTRAMMTQNHMHQSDGRPVIACGMARYEGENSLAQVFQRADQLMYECKRKLKQG